MNMPVYKQTQVDQTATPGVRRTTSASPEVLGNGGQLTRLGQAVGQIHRQIQDQQNLDRVLQAEATFTDQARQFELDALNQQGSHAHGLSGQADQWWQKTSTAMAGNLDNAEQQRAFQQQIASRREAMLRSIGKHETAQRNQSLNASANASMVSAVAFAAMHPFDDDIRIRTHTGIRQTIHNQAERLGWSDEVKQLAVQEQLTALHSQIVQAQAVDDLDAAKAYYQKHEAEIMADDRRTLKDRFASIERRQNSDRKAAQAVYVRHYRTMRNTVAAGEFLDRDFIAQYRNLAGQITDPAVSQDIMDTLNWHTQLREFVNDGLSYMDMLNQRDSIAALQVSGVDDVRHKTFMLNGANNILGQIKEDPYQAAIRFNLQDPGLSLGQALKEGSLGDYLAQQTQKQAGVEAMWGIKTPLIPDTEAGILAQTLSEPAGFDTLRQLVGSLGGDSYDVLGQLLKQGHHEVAVMGDLLTQPDPAATAAAHLVHQGRIMEEADAKTYLLAGEHKTSFESGFNQYITGSGAMHDGVVDTFNLFGDDWQIQHALMEAAKKAYVALSARDMDRSGEYDEDRAEQAFKAVVGQVVELDGPGMGFGWKSDNYKLITPRRNMGEDEVTDWLASLPESTFDRVAHLDPDELLQRVRNLDYRLRHTGDQGHYYLERFGRFVQGQNGQPFVLSYP